MPRARRFARPLRGRLATLLLVVAAAAACGDRSTDPPVATTVSAEVSTLLGVVGEPLGSLLVARVQDQRGAPLPGVTVRFEVQSGNGALAAANVVTDTAGTARTRWTLGPRTGEQRATAGVPGTSASTSFLAVASAGAPSAVSIVAGNNQSALAGSALPVRPAVRVRDRFGNNVDSAAVFFSVTQGGGMLSANGATTNAEGVATGGTWTLGSALGVNRLSALVVASGVTGNPLEFTATAVAGAASRLVALTATQLTAPVNTLVAPSPSVRVTDAAGNPVAGVPVTFIASTGAAVDGVFSTSDANGVATVGSWRLGASAGEYTLAASAPGLTTPLLFTATARPSTPAAVSALAGTGQSAAVGRPVAIEPAVRVLDAFGNPVAGVAVLFDVTAGGGFATGRSTVTNGNGVATVGGWTLGDAAGTNALRATVSGSGIAGNPVLFEATAVAGTASRLVALTATQLSAGVSALVAPSPSVRVTDAAGNPVAGVTVTFTGSAGSTVDGGVVTSDGTGAATVGSWRLGPSAGEYTLAASAPGVATPLLFTATALPSSAAAVSAFAGTGQSAMVGRPVDVDPAVRVVDATGSPVMGAAVLFEVTAGGGFAVGRNAVTNGNGVASVGGWTLGDSAGTNTLRATVSGTGIAGNPVLFNATATAGPAATVSVQAGNGQSAAVNSPVATPPSVIVRDTRGNPVPNVSVQFVVTSGGGTVTGGSATTSSTGVATVGSWTLGPSAGTQTLVARVAGLPDAVFTATGLASTVELLTAANLGAVPANGLVATPPSIRLRNAAGNPMAGVQVTFTLDPSVGSGSLTGAVQTTGADGIATVTSWRVGTVAGVVAGVRVFVDGLDLAGNEPRVVALVVAGPAAQAEVAPTSVPAQEAAANTPVATLPAVLVRDAFGNPVPNATVTFTPAAGGGTVTGGTAATNGSGIATVGSWTMPAGSGSRTLIATVAGTTIPVIAFTATVP